MKELSAKTDLQKKDVVSLMEQLVKIAYTQVKKNGEFVLPGFGKLVKLDRKARMGRNPATGESIKIPAKKVVKFRIAKVAKEAIL